MNSLSIAGMAANNLLMGPAGGLPALNAALVATGLGGFIGSGIGWGVSSIMAASSDSGN